MMRDVISSPMHTQGWDGMEVVGVTIGKKKGETGMEEEEEKKIDGLQLGLVQLLR